MKCGVCTHCHKALAKEFQLFRRKSSVFVRFPSLMCACIITVAKSVSAGRPVVTYEAGRPEQMQSDEREHHCWFLEIRDYYVVTCNHFSKTS